MLEARSSIIICNNAATIYKVAYLLDLVFKSWDLMIHLYGSVTLHMVGFFGVFVAINKIC